MSSNHRSRGTTLLIRKSVKAINDAEDEESTGLMGDFEEVELYSSAEIQR